MAGKHPLGLRLIALLKLASAALLAAAGLGIFHYLHLGDMQRFIAQLHLAPEKPMIHTVLRKMTGMNDHTLREIGAVSFIYAVLYLVEGVGLLKEKRWAEYLTVIITGSFLPLEAYALFLHPDVMHGVVLVLNALIVVYLIGRLRAGR